METLPNRAFELGHPFLEEAVYIRLMVDSNYFSCVRNGIMVMSLGVVLFFSAHDAFHRACSAILLTWGMWLVSIDAERIREKALRMVNLPSKKCTISSGLIIALCAVIFMAVEAHRGSLLVPP
jgi:hypothetical protein